MEANHKPNRIHPLVAIAAVAVTVLSITGVAAITGLLPASHGESGPGSASVAHMFAPVPAATGDAAANFTTPVEPKAQLAANDAEKPVPQAAQKPAGNEHQGTRPASSGYRQHTTQVAQARATCRDCGRVEAVTPVKEQGQASGVGIVAGAVLGGVLGNQVGGGNGRKLATVAGAVGGGYAGNEVEKRTRATSSYQVRVRMENGTSRTFRQTSDSWRVGDRVRIVNGELTMRG
ncbi:glycine zipper 2TM domain-containing protein [Janthinobacterium sp. 17J80-10]|uniref:glycine zipper 2TM domain-containing protein n=1 Tax=Janthinobacterium sp. 17J80-10 TaxID=2497863 RepID=UPI0010057B9E|nr:glycine zipper 2TM domain-containing protein [Janthinobacterium sp. 17J80-10]QAU35126.1 glycine zipper 2TM domain-containing protein [Janthinobacterium sp. 17J80-10]